MPDPKIAAALLKQRPELKIPTLQRVQQEGGIFDFLDPGAAAGFVSQATGVGNPNLTALLASFLGGGPEDLLKLAPLLGLIVTKGMKKGAPLSDTIKSKKSQSGLRDELAEWIGDHRKAFKPDSKVTKELTGNLKKNVGAARVPPTSSVMKGDIGAVDAGEFTEDFFKSSGFEPQSGMFLSEELPTTLTLPHEGGHLSVDYSGEVIQKLRQSMASGDVPIHPEVAERFDLGKANPMVVANENFADWYRDYIKSPEIVPESVRKFFQGIGGKFQHGGQVPQAGFRAIQEPKKQLPGTISPQEMLDTFLRGLGMGAFGGADPVGAVLGSGAEALGAPPLAAAIGSIGIPGPDDAIRIAKLLKNLPKTLKRTGAQIIHEPSSVGDFFTIKKGGSNITAAVNPKDNMLDLLKIEGGGEGLSSFDELAEFLGIQGRRGTTTMTKEGTESIGRAVEQGFSTPNPAGPGVLQTGQEQGLEALIDSLISKIAPGFRKGGKVDRNAVIDFILQGFQ